MLLPTIIQMPLEQWYVLVILFRNNVRFPYIHSLHNFNLILYLILSTSCFANICRKWVMYDDDDGDLLQTTTSHVTVCYRMQQPYL